jgi:hypothetical protein
VGKHMLPCGVAMREDVMCVGGEIRSGEAKWAVEEVWEW